MKTQKANSFFLKTKAHIFTNQNIYTALLIFLILGMVHVPMVLRFFVIGCSFFPNRLLRIICPAVISGAYFVIFKIPAEGIIIYSLLIFVALCVIERQKHKSSDRRNDICILLFAMLAMGLLDFLSGFFVYG